MKIRTFLYTTLLTTSSWLISAQEQIKIGIIGLDTSHSPAFVQMLNGETKKEKFKEYRVVAAYPYGSKTIPSSYERIPDYTDQVKKLGVEIVPSIADLLKKVDCVMLETNDGNLHPEQAHEVLKSRKIMFIDKPIGASLAQAIAIFELAKRYNVPVFSSSSLRYATQTQKIRNGEFGKVLGANCYSPHKQEPSHPDFGWYGIHGIETLFTVMGTGCISVSRISSDSTDVVIGRWNDGRIGSFRGMQQAKQGYGGTAFTTSGTVAVGTYEGYEVLLDRILHFFKTRIIPVSAAETLEIFTFMEASNRSKQQGGKAISMEKTYQKGVKDAQKLLRELK